MNFEGFFDFLQKIGPMIIRVSEMVAPFVEFLKDVGLKFPSLVAFLYDGVMRIFDRKDEMNQTDAHPTEVDAMIKTENEALVASALEKFHGSGPQVTTQLVRGTIEALVAVIKAERYGLGDVMAKEEKARALGYLVSPDLDRAYEAWPQLFGKRD